MTKSHNFSRESTHNSTDSYRGAIKEEITRFVVIVITLHHFMLKTKNVVNNCDKEEILHIKVLFIIQPNEHTSIEVINFVAFTRTAVK